MEFAADQAAVEMAWRAGYDPQQLPKAIARIDEAGRAYAPRNEPKTWTALHPPVAERLAQVQKLLVTLPAAEGLALGTARYKGAIR
jgi:predicted Zn-dependent protease